MKDDREACTLHGPLDVSGFGSVGPNASNIGFRFVSTECLTCAELPEDRRGQRVSICPARTDHNGECSGDSDGKVPCWSHRPMSPPRSIKVASCLCGEACRPCNAGVHEHDCQPSRSIKEANR